MKSIEAACQFFGVTEDELLDENRKKGVISKGRHFIMWYHRMILKETFQKSADAVCMDKCSAMYAIKTMNKRIEENKTLKAELDRFISLV